MNRRVNQGVTLLTGAGIGAGLMYLLDPDKGPRRRALMRDRGVSGLHTTSDALGKIGRDLRNRARGVAAAAGSRVRRDPVSNEQLVERVRSRMGRFVSHPHAIDVVASHGCVRISGPILAHETEDLLSAVRSVRGVCEVENRLEPHESAEGVPSLQGGATPPGAPFELAQHNWTPAARMMVGTLGAAMMSYGIVRRGPMAIPSTLLGAGLLARGIANVPLSTLIGVTGGRRAVDIQKNLWIDAPVEQVYNIWSHTGNFPRFMSNLIEVRDIGNGRSHWVAKGPAGVPVHWDAVVTRMVPNEVIAWRSEPGSPIRNAGFVRFQPETGGTQVQIRLSYNPPGGAFAAAAARLFGADPKSEMDEDLVRLKSLIETGTTTAHGETVTLERVEPDIGGRG